jgi:hypothetical protein
MRKYLLFVVVMMVGSVAWGQAPNIEWAKCYGGTNSDWANSIQQTNDGGYIMAGYSYSNDGNVTGHHGGSDYWIVKLDTTGGIQWQKSLGGTGDEEAYSIQQTTDGGFIVAGISNSDDDDVTGNHGDSDYWVVKLNATGFLQWQRTLGGSGWDGAYSIQQTNDGGYIVAGLSTSNDGNVTGHHFGSDYWVVKLNTTGAIQWQKSLGGSLGDVAYSIQQTNDGGYIVAGYSASNDGDIAGNHGNTDYWLVKLDIAGNILWQKPLGGSLDDVAYSIQQTNDGGYILTGNSYSNDGNINGHHGNSIAFDYWVVKLDSAGIIQWQKSLGGLGDDWANSIEQTNDGGYIVSGYSASIDGDVTGHHGIDIFPDYWIVKLDTTGSIQWQKSLGGTGDEEAYSIQQTTDGGLIVAGISYSDDDDVTGHHGGINNGDYWVVKLAGTNGIEEIPTSSISIFPNPTTGQVNIKGIAQPTVAVYNLMGQRVVLSQGSNEVSLAQLPSGMYLVQVFNKDMEPVKSEQIMKE